MRTTSTSIDTLIENSLRSFIEDIFDQSWYGKEREAVSLYALGYLANYCQPQTILYNPTQIGIEVRVPKATGLGKKAEICKDLVIWPRPGMTCWTKEKRVENYPLAILEWKVNQSRVFNDDVEWLRAFSVSASTPFTGYALCVDLKQRHFRLSCTKIQEGKTEPNWLVI